MPRLSQTLSNLNTWRFLTAGTLIALATGESTFWWIAAVPWFVLNLPGLLLSTIPAWLVLAAGPTAAETSWISDGFMITLCVALPSSVSMLMSPLWPPLLQKSGLFDQFHYPEA